MGVRRSVVVLVLSAATFSCAGKGREAKSAEPDPWAGYQGTYATGAGAADSPSARLKAAKVEPAPPVKTESAKLTSDAPEKPTAAAAVSSSASASAAPTPATKSKAGVPKPIAKKKKK